MGIIWTIIIGFIAGVIAKFIMPGPNEPQGFVLTAILGIVGAFVASFLGQMLGWYGPGEGAGLIGAVIGAIIVLFVYGCWPENGLTCWRCVLRRAAVNPLMRAPDASAETRSIDSRRKAGVSLYFIFWIVLGWPLFVTFAE